MHRITIFSVYATEERDGFMIRRQQPEIIWALNSHLLMLVDACESIVVFFSSAFEYGCFYERCATNWEIRNCIGKAFH